MRFSSQKCSSEKSFSFFFLYCVTCAIISMLLFLYGFFPMKKSGEIKARFADLAHIANNSSFVEPDVYQKHVGRLIFLVIDGFRWDFIHGDMPYTNLLIEKSQGCLLTARCHPPTATMPRIKALMTGSIPNYIDVALNLGSQQIKEDNLVHQAVQNGLKILFYGDETWLQLFPDMFVRAEGTTSFIVSDFKEVDLNVSRHLGRELQANDWDIMILHYLGLDHIGHMSGPSSHSISPKLQEMDDVIKELHKSMEQWDAHHPDMPSMIVVVGDHGMHDLGSHGGATLGEVLVSLIFIGKGCHCAESSGQEVLQIDVTATLSVLLGLPIPQSNLGVIIPEALGMLSPEQYLYALHCNAHQVAQQFLALNPDGADDDSYQMYIKAHREYVVWLANGKAKSLASNIKVLYKSAMEEMRMFLIKKLVEFDILGMGIGCILLIQIFLLVTFQTEREISLQFKLPQKVLLLLIILISFIVVLKLCIFDENHSVLCSCNNITLFLMAIFIFLISFNFWAISVFVFPSLSIFKLQKCLNLHTTSSFLLIGAILHTISLSSSSFVEEEHQTWYHLWVTFLLLLCLSNMVSLGSIYSNGTFPLVLILLGHRVLRKLNQTGDKWASLPDIGDWLNRPEHSMILSGVFIVSLFSIWLSTLHLEGSTVLIDKLLFGFALLCPLIYRSSIGDIALPFTMRDSLAVNLFWVFWVVIMLRSLIQFIYRPSVVKMLRSCILLWLLISVLLLRPHNLPLLPSMFFASATMHKFLHRVTDLTIAHIWLGVIWFYYQGNSNSLATIDVAAGYIGVNQQQMIRSGILVGIHTLNAPVLSVLLLWHGLALQYSTFKGKFRSFSRSFRLLFLFKLLPLSTYCVIVTLQRHHLFVWSVFAPKLLYEAVLFLCMLLLIICCSLSFTLCHFMRFPSEHLLLKAFVGSKARILK